eukprot:COSAG02_NODE_32336_length_518_cov_0.615752_1_plen_78_part_10
MSPSGRLIPCCTNTGENELYRAFRKNEPKEERRQRHIVQWAVFCVIGICTGTTAFCSAGERQTAEWWLAMPVLGWSRT